MKEIVSALTIARMEEIVALNLWRLGAIKINATEPFRLVSGNYSPVYINCRRVISDNLFMQLFTTFAQIICQHNSIAFNIIAGSETAGIPFAAYFAHSLSLPMVYVRKAAKSHGIPNLIEGEILSASTVILVDDVITDAGTKLDACSAVESAGGVVKDVLVIFDREQGGCETLKNHNVRGFALTNMTTTLRVGREIAAISNQDAEGIDHYLANPKSWHVERRLPYTAS